MRDTSTEGRRIPLFRKPSQWLALALTAILGGLVWTSVDLDPKVETDFFFASDDPQLEAQRRLIKLYGYSEQLVIAVRAPNLFSRTHLNRTHRLTRDLESIRGVQSVQSLTRGPVDTEKVLERDPDKLRNKLEDSPFWSRLLLARGGGASLILVLLDEQDAATITAIDRAIAEHDRPDFDIGISGVAYASEHIRRGLSRDLRVFSVAALIVFTLLIALLFRSIPVLVGTLLSALTACFATFLVRALVGMKTGVLTPNLWTIAFVLTLSHVVYITASYWKRSREHGPAPLREALRANGPASCWSLVANLLGFSSLLLAPAKPLRDFGLSGVIAALAAIACAYAIHPLFLRSARVPPSGRGRLLRRLESFFTTRHAWIALTVGTVCLLLAPWSLKVDTDPPLPSYFARGGEIRDGIESVDRAGGTSPLELVVRNADGTGLDDKESFERLMALQRDLERDPAVGAVISIAILMAETKEHWLSFLLSWEKRVDRLDRPENARVGRSFITADRRLGRFILRMKEEGRVEPRAAIANRLVERARHRGFEVEVAGGLFPLQGEMAALVQASVLRGLGGLTASFFLIAWITSRSLRIALAMTLCLLLVPLGLFGVVALLGVPLDIIAAPAANVALPMGIDELIHIGYALRRSRGKGFVTWSDWQKALAELWLPILASALIVGAGFALFLLSRFPPTQRLGLLISVGTMLTDAVVLVVLPALATISFRRNRNIEVLGRVTHSS